MSPRPRLPKMQWADDSIRVENRTPGPADEEENIKIFSACHAELNEVRLRLMVGCYGPGTETSPKSNIIGRLVNPCQCIAVMWRLASGFASSCLGG